MADFKRERRYLMYLECHNNQKQQETSKRKYLIVKLF